MIYTQTNNFRKPQSTRSIKSKPRKNAKCSSLEQTGCLFSYVQTGLSHPVAQMLFPALSSWNERNTETSVSSSLLAPRHLIANT